MLILLSPAKTLDFENPSATEICTQPDFLNLSHDLIHGLAKFNCEQIASLMGLSTKLAQLNYQRFQKWTINHKASHCKQALLAFKGDVYEGLRAWEFNDQEFQFAQSRMRILSGLYGLLKPLDLIQPYRLEMGTVYANPAGKDLYAFWGDRLANAIRKDLNEIQSNTVINLASVEYAKAAQLKKTEANIISPIFKDENKGKFKIISFYAKKARGMMARYLIANQISSPSDLKSFNIEGYKYCTEESTNSSPTFKRSASIRNAA